MMQILKNFKITLQLINIYLKNLQKFKYLSLLYLSNQKTQNT